MWTVIRRSLSPFYHQNIGYLNKMELTAGWILSLTRKKESFTGCIKSCAGTKTGENIKTFPLNISATEQWKSMMQRQRDAGATLLCFTGGEVSEQDIRPKGQPIHILCCCGKDLPCFNQSSTAGLRLTWSLQCKKTSKYISQLFTLTCAVLINFSRFLQGEDRCYFLWLFANCNSRTFHTLWRNLKKKQTFAVTLYLLSFRAFKACSDNKHVTGKIRIKM